MRGQQQQPQHGSHMVPMAIGYPLERKQKVNEVPPEIRADFIRKVYSLLSMQLVITFVVGAVFHKYATVQWAVAHIYILQAASMGSIFLLLGVMCCCPKVARTVPHNYIMLFTLTVLISITVGFTVTCYTGPSVLAAVGATALVFLGLTAYACYTKTDFTGFQPYLHAALMAMISFSFVMWVWSMFGPLPPGLRMAYSFMGVLLFSCYIVYDTQMIVGGKHSQQFDIDDYAFAALSIYLDIINMFLYLLQLFGERR